MTLYYNPRLDTIGILDGLMLKIEDSIYMVLTEEWIKL